MQGTLIRVFDIATRRQLTELRRGTDTAIVYWYVIVRLCFNLLIVLACQQVYVQTTLVRNTFKTVTALDAFLV